MTRLSRARRPPPDRILGLYSLRLKGGRRLRWAIWIAPAADSKSMWLVQMSRSAWSVRYEHEIAASSERLRFDLEDRPWLD